VRLAATGITHVGVMDFDTVKEHNLDRMIGATPDDALVGRRKIDVALREMTRAATASHPEFAIHDQDITTPDGQASALDYDVIFSCVDRPYPRAILNQLAYTDLIPVIDGGIVIDTLTNGAIRNATVRVHTLTPGTPCMQCIGQIDGADVALDRQGLLDDPEYIVAAGRTQPARQNVAVLSVGVTSGLLGQFVSLVASPGGRGVSAPLRLSLATHTLEHLIAETKPHCPYEGGMCSGDARATLTRAAAPEA
jgi:molybdopterin/thiamine biosynthesis adenylyltransferase